MTEQSVMCLLQTLCSCAAFLASVFPSRRSGYGLPKTCGDHVDILNLQVNSKHIIAQKCCDGRRVVKFEQSSLLPNTR